MVKSTADELTLIDKSLTDDDLIIHVLNGDGSEFCELTATIRTCENLIAFEELHEKLLDFDSLFKKEASSELSIITANVTRRNTQPRNSTNS